eukprot:s3436_g9.t1
MEKTYTIVFGEQILFKPVGAEGRKRSSPLEARVASGRYVGTASRNSDLLVMTPTGVVKGHSLQRRAELDRWSLEGFSELRGLPWKMSNPVERAPPNRADMPALVGEQPKGEERDFKPRHLYVLKSDIAKFGYTPCCPGCLAQIEGSAARSHNEECRLRIQRKLMETDEGKARVEKAKERVEADHGRKAKRPALEGRPPPDVPEVAASEAAGAPLARPMEIAEEVAPEAGGQRGKKRRGEDLEDLYRSEAPDPGSTDEPIVVSQQGGASGSGGASPAPEPMQDERDTQPIFDEEPSIGFIEKIFQDHGVKCSRSEAESLSNLVASLGVDYKASSVLNEGLWLNLEEKGWKLQTDKESEALKVICKSDDRKTWKRTLTFKEGRVQVPTNYPPKLVDAIARGIRAQPVLDGQMKEIGHVGGPDPHEEANYEECHHEMLPSATELYVKEPVIDANTGVELDPKKVGAARATELEWIKRQDVYTKVPTSMCYEETNRPPITLKWVDRNKGDATTENYRSRLVVREIKSQGQAALIPQYALFSSMPPLEALKLLCSLLVTLRVSRRGGKLAHFYGRAARRIFVTLPECDESPGYCRLLNKTMYGTRDASATWQRDYTELLETHEFTVGQAWPCIFTHKDKDIKLLVHGDDFLVLADEEGHAFVDQVLKKRYEFKCDGHIGPGQEKQTMSVLNRLIKYHPESGLVTHEADPRHTEALIRELHLENAKPTKTPGEKKKHSEVMKTLELPPLDEGMQKKYRSLTMRAAFLAQDRPDIAEATKCLARHMKTPHETAFNDLKRLVRYLRGRPRLVYEYWPQRYQRELTTYCDSDHAGCLITRRSTTGLITMWGAHNIKHSSNIQSTISLSSGESEYYAIVKAAAVSLSIQALMADWGLTVSLKIKSDSSAARGTSQRQGLGSTRHIETRYLWVQEKVQRKAFTLEKVSTNSNYSDICTKPLPEAALDKHLRSMNLKFSTEKASGAKQLV